MKGVTLEKYKGKRACMFCMGKEPIFNFHAAITYSNGSRSTDFPVCSRCYGNIKYDVVAKEIDNIELKLTEYGKPDKRYSPAEVAKILKEAYGDDGRS